MNKFSQLLIDKYQKALSAADMGFWEWDLERDKIHFDAGLAKLYQFPPKDMIISPEEWYAKIHPEDAPKAREYMQVAKESHESLDALFRIVSNDQSIKYVRTHALRIRDAEKNINSFVGLNWNVTNEILLRRDAKIAKSFLEKAMNAVPDPIFMKDQQHRWIFCNKEFEKLMGRKKEDFLGKSDYDFFPKEIADVYWEKDKQVLMSGKANENEEKFVGPSGETRYILTKKSAFKVSESENVLIGVIRDITEKNKLDSQFRLMISLIDSSGDIFGFTDSTGVPLYVNRTAQEVYGIEVGKKQALEYLSPLDQVLFKESIIDKVKKNGSWEGEVSFISAKNGEEIPTWINCFIVQSGPNPEDILFAVSGSDLRKLKEVQNSLIAQSKMASLGEMAAEIAHEINNPLSIIQGKAQLLKDELSIKSGIDPEKLKRSLEQIETNSFRIKKIIDSSRAFARKTEKDPMEYVSILNVIEEVFEISKERFQNKHISLTLSVNKAITFADLVLARASEIIQVLVNLLNNSFDAVKNQNDGWVKIGLSCTEDRYCIEIIDSGGKISPEISERMMEPFFTTKPTGEGTGLGLSLSKQIAEAQGGHLYYDSKASNTRFVFELKRPLQRSN